MNKAIRAWNKIRDDMYLGYIGARLGVHMYIQRNVGKCLDDLMRVKRYWLKHYDKWTIYDVKEMLDIIDHMGCLSDGYGFEAQLLRRSYDLTEAEEIREKFGL